MKKPTSELAFDLAAVRDIKRLLNRVVGKTLIYEKAIKKRIRLAALPPEEVVGPLPTPEPEPPPPPPAPARKRAKKVKPQIS